MIRYTPLLLLFLGVSSSWQSIALAGGDDEKIIGTWERLHEKGKENDKDKEYLEETWIIKKTKDKWSVSGKFYAPGKGEVGNFKSKDVKFADGTLTFTQDFFKLPKGFTNGAAVTCSAEEDRLDVSFKPKKGEEARDNFKRGGDGSELLGTWKNSDKTQMWVIEKDKKGNLTVRGEWSDKKGKVFRSFKGVGVRYFQKELMFLENFDKGPGSLINCVARGDELLLLWANGRAKGKATLKLEGK